MFHSYYDWFQLSDNLVKSISYIIYKMEGDNYICKKLEFTICEHKELIFTSPLDGYKPYTGGINGLNYEQIRVVKEKYGKYIERTEHYRTFPQDHQVQRRDYYNISCQQQRLSSLLLLVKLLCHKFSEKAH